MISIQTEDFDPAEEYSRLKEAAVDAGAIVIFTGLVREDHDHRDAGGSPVRSLHLEHYAGMTEKSLQSIVDEANTRWRLLATRVIHRVGELKPSDQIVLVGSASAHRQDAFESAQFIMDFLKSKAPFWKKQTTEQGSDWVESRDSDAEAIERWQKSV
ncbi:MAG: molybdopterin synthase catalytic subunit MoaE [Gammaproteobacteria bacterium]|jgi:molybdopterin synthase catalytic subunit|nr:molybdopterin synthase catalytic subunit MoaE [Gammaproteobacteria bacterium]HJN96506.1 molybdopterin synthase catalytic subunit MoaE [Gammaproteobacteria bacterium]|tara:strand:+ start:295 stop:765 length:471 start_codon:yes stop_codon:yes gene_type:complete